MVARGGDETVHGHPTVHRRTIVVRSLVGAGDERGSGRGEGEGAR